MTNPDSPLVSVVIPCYNRSGIIQKTLDSVLNQSLQDFEIILVDDFSDDIDQLKKVLAKMNSAKIRLLEHTHNQHGGAARNTGIKAAQGKYLALLDSDDIWHPDKLTMSIPYCLHSKDVVYTQLSGFGYIFPNQAKKQNEQVCDYLICNKGAMQSSTLLMHTKFAQKVLFNPDLTRFQDYDFTLRLENYGANFVFINQTLTMMSSHNEPRISDGGSIKPALEWLKIANNMSKKARAQFYLDRVAKILLVQGEKKKILTFLPEDIQANMEWKLKLKFYLMRYMPQYLFNSLQFIKKVLKNILPQKIKNVIKEKIFNLKSSNTPLSF